MAAPLRAWGPPDWPVQFRFERWVVAGEEVPRYQRALVRRVVQQALNDILASASFTGWTSLVGNAYNCGTHPQPRFRVSRVTPCLVWVALVAYPAGL